MSENKWYEEVKRGEQAKMILDNPVLFEVTGSIKEKLLSLLVSDPEDDLEQLRRHKYLYRSVDFLMLELNRIVKRGYTAAKEIENLEKEKAAKHATQ